MASISEEPKMFSGEQVESMSATMSKSNTGTLHHDPRTAESPTVNAGGEIASRIQGLDSPFTKVKYFVTTQGAPVQFNKDYFIAEADARSDRRLDLEEHKWKKVVMNPKWRDGLYMQLRDADRGGAMFNLWYPGDQVWLCGRGSEDVKMGKTRSDSQWFLKEEGRDSLGHQKYSLWTWQTEVMDLNGIWFSENSVSQIGYDKDFELRSYAKGYKPDNRWLYIKILDPKDRNTIWHEGQKLRVHV